MGYRSEVAIRCEDGAYEMFKEVVQGFAPDKTFDEENDHLFYWGWIKWYENYPEIATIEKVMSKLDGIDEDVAIEKKMGYRFLRIGEDYSDVETRCNVYDIELYMIREIDLSDFEAK